VDEGAGEGGLKILGAGNGCGSRSLCGWFASAERLGEDVQGMGGVGGVGEAQVFSVEVGS